MLTRLTRFYFLVFIFISLFTYTHAQESPRFIVVTPEKTGTHLLTKLMSRLVNKEVFNCWEHALSSKDFAKLLDEVENKQMFLHMHALPTEEIIKTLKKKHYKVFFLMRDPRDVMISLLYYIEKGWSIGPCGLDKPYGQLTLPEKLHELITGARYGLATVDAIIVRRLDWMKEKKSFVYTAHFENLVGTEGGGSDSSQLKEITKISQHIGLELSKIQLKNVSTNLWGADPGEKTTFRKGQLGAWKEGFSEEHRLVFKQRYSKLLIDLGYEKNSKW